MDRMEPIIRLAGHQLGITGLRPGSELAGGHTATVFTVEGGEERLVLRLRRHAPTPPRMAWEHGLLGHIHRHGFPCPRPVWATDGSGTPLGPAELLTFLDHDSTLDHHDHACHRLGLARLLGRLHRLTVDHQPPPPGGQWMAGMPVSPRAKYLEGPLGTGIARYREALGAAGDRHVPGVLDELAGILEGEYRDIERDWGPGPHVVIHNDFYGNNVLFLGDEIAGLVDWDFSTVGSYVVDVGEALFGIMIWDGSETGVWGLPRDARPRWHEGEEFMDAYAREAGFAVDRRLCLRFLVVKVISMILYPAVDLSPTSRAKAESVTRAREVVHRLMGGINR